MGIPDDAFETVEDFLENVRFQQWARGKAPEDAPFWQELLARYPDKTPLYEKAVAIILVVGGRNSPETYENNRAAQVRKLLFRETSHENRYPLWQWLRWGVAAMLVISIGIWWQHAYKKPLQADKLWPANISSGQRITKQNPDRKTMLVNLPDGSSVLLSKGSSISFEEDMTGRQRIVSLIGEGFFEVVKDAKRPFLVYTDKLTSTVVGTSFRVKAFPDSSEALVAVKTGKVFVDQKSKTHGGSSRITLLPNQQMQVFDINNKLTTKVSETIAPSEMTLVQKEEFEFKFTPVAQAYKILESNYAVRIQYDTDKMRRCTITASLKDEPFLEKLRLICLATETTYQIRGDQISITGAGCP
ncbi:FecR family protein [Dyadobacter sp. CY323]|uniref:FecR family protein n=1 Tax=Dyadobacter sp. CY323 TaxID=2907302 RepID=UPI001F1D8E31|nr:FecR family protein [Dyadobacter sp. CY323]MCE6991485.1 FecR family protein [Dyadobacter sp. CY323]